MGATAIEPEEFKDRYVMTGLPTAPSHDPYEGPLPILRTWSEGIFESRELRRFVPGPWDLHQPHPASFTGNAWDPGVQIGLMLEEVEMTPRLPGRVMGRASHLPTRGAAEPASLPEIQVEVEALRFGIEPRPIHEPRRLKSQRHLEQIHVPHPGFYPLLPRWPSGGTGSRAAPRSGSTIGTRSKATRPHHTQAIPDTTFTHPEQRGAESFRSPGSAELAKRNS